MPHYKKSSLRDFGLPFEQDYKKFQRFLKAMCLRNNWALVNYSFNHFDVTAHIRDVWGNYVYLYRQYTGVGEAPKWRDTTWAFMIRNCTNSKDSGSDIHNINVFVTQRTVEQEIKALFARKPKSRSKHLLFNWKRNRKINQ